MRSLFRLLTAASFTFFCAFSQAQIPDTQSSHGIAYISGGVGEEEAQAILTEAKNWPLMLELSQLQNGRGVWIFGATINLLNAQQQRVFAAQADGPYMLINVPLGIYLVEASYEGVVQKRTVSIKLDQPQKLSIFWR